MKNFRFPEYTFTFLSGVVIMTALSNLVIYSERLKFVDSDFVVILLLSVSFISWIAIASYRGLNKKNQLFTIYALLSVIVIPILFLVVLEPGILLGIIFVLNFTIWSLLSTFYAAEKVFLKKKYFQGVFISLIAIWGILVTMIYVGLVLSLPYATMLLQVFDQFHWLIDARVFLIMFAIILAIVVSAIEALGKALPEIRSLTDWKIRPPTSEGLWNVVKVPFFEFTNVCLLLLNSIADYCWSFLQVLGFYLKEIGIEFVRFVESVFSNTIIWVSTGLVILLFVSLLISIYIIDVSSSEFYLYLTEKEYGNQLINFLMLLIYGILLSVSSIIVVFSHRVLLSKTNITFVGSSIHLKIITEDVAGALVYLLLAAFLSGLLLLIFSVIGIDLIIFGYVREDILFGCFMILMLLSIGVGVFSEMGKRTESEEQSN